MWALFIRMLTASSAEAKRATMMEQYKMRREREEET
jgi:hypothetical protein